MKIGEERKRTARSGGRVECGFKVCCRNGDGFDNLTKILLSMDPWM